MHHLGRHLGAVAAATLLFSAPLSAQQRLVTVTATNLAPVNSIAFAPLHLGFHRGIFDAFDIGMTAGAGIISVAEGGSGTQWQADFAAADPMATRGTVGGLLLAGQSVSQSFMVDVGRNQYFSFANMVVPSNDFFLGNDQPLLLFGSHGELLLSSIVQTTNQIWDAGSELFDPAAAGFVGNNGLRSAQNSVVAFNFAELAGFNGLTTGAGYTFNSQLTAGQGVYRIDFTSVAVSEPRGVSLLAFAALPFVTVVRRRLRAMRA